MNGVQTRLKCKPNVKRCKRFVFPSHSPLLHHNALTAKAISHFQADHILTRFVFPPLYDVMYLENPIKAIDWLNEGNVPDLIISDIRMPLMRGDEFLRYMKANELFKSIPIVMLSSEESTTERIKLLEEGAEDYILKPFNPLELKIRIKKIID